MVIRGSRFAGWRRLMGGAIVVALALSSAALAPASAQQSATDSSESRSPDPITAEEQGPDLDELEQYAARFDVSVDQALEELLREDELLELISPAIDGESRFAGWGVDRDPVQAWVVLQGDGPVPPKLQEIAAANSDITIEVGARYTLEELRTTIAESVEVLGLVDSVVGMGVDGRRNMPIVYVNNTAVDPQTGELVRRPPDDVRQTSREARVRQEVDQLGSFADTPFVIRPSAPSRDGKKIKGGKTTQGCTTSFTVRLPWALPVFEVEFGVLTAGHCTSATTTQAVSMSVLASVASASRDVRLLGIPEEHSAIPKFWNGVQYRTVNAVQLPGEGVWVCHYGRTTGKRCGDVLDTEFAPTGGAGCPCLPVFVSVEGLGCPGDSGGPAFRNIAQTAAVGIYKGQANANECSPPTPDPDDYWYYGKIANQLNTLSAIGGNVGFGTVLLYLG